MDQAKTRIMRAAPRLMNHDTKQHIGTLELYWTIRASRVVCEVSTIWSLLECRPAGYVGLAFCISRIWTIWNLKFAIPLRWTDRITHTWTEQPPMASTYYPSGAQDLWVSRYETTHWNIGALLDNSSFEICLRGEYHLEFAWMTPSWWGWTGFLHVTSTDYLEFQFCVTPLLHRKNRP